jgi:hypothetical protein
MGLLLGVRIGRSLLRNGEFYVLTVPGFGEGVRRVLNFGDCRLGYQCGIAERQMFLNSLYEQLEDREKVLLNKKVMAIVHERDCVRVKCADGTEFEGSIVIGADGIHSRTRQEMQKLAEDEGPPGIMDKDKNSKCILLSLKFFFSFRAYNSRANVLFSFRVAGGAD